MNFLTSLFFKVALEYFPVFCTIHLSSSVPDEEQHPHNMILPPSYHTVRMVFALDGVSPCSFGLSVAPLTGPLLALSFDE